MFIKRLYKKVLKTTRRLKAWLPIYDINPASRVFGLDRGTAIDRYYIEKFLFNNNLYIRGRVLEIAENTYSKKFGTDVDRFDILHFDNSNPQATIIGDLTSPGSLPENEYDCFICTQTLNVIYDFRQAIQTSYKLLSDKGIFLGTVPGISQISSYDMQRWGDYWRFTDLSIRRSFEEVFGKGNVETEVFGNYRTCSAFLDGISLEELPCRLLGEKDYDYQLIIGIKAVKHV